MEESYILIHRKSSKQKLMGTSVILYENHPGQTVHLESACGVEGHTTNDVLNASNVSGQGWNL